MNEYKKLTRKQVIKTYFEGNHETFRFFKKRNNLKHCKVVNREHLYEINPAFEKLLKEEGKVPKNEKHKPQSKNTGRTPIDCLNEYKKKQSPFMIAFNNLKYLNQ